MDMVTVTGIDHRSGYKQDWVDILWRAAAALLSVEPGRLSIKTHPSCCSY